MFLLKIFYIYLNLDLYCIILLFSYSVNHLGYLFYTVHRHLGHRAMIKVQHLTKNTMSKAKLHQIKQEVKEKALAKMRYQWFKEYKRSKNVGYVCRKYGISRSVFYYWKKRLDLKSSSGKHKTSKANRLIAYSRRPKTNPREYSQEVTKLIIRIRKRTNRGAEHIWFMLKDKYAIHVSVTGIYKVLKRNGLIKARRYKRVFCANFS